MILEFLDFLILFFVSFFSVSIAILVASLFIFIGMVIFLAIRWKRRERYWRLRNEVDWNAPNINQGNFGQQQQQQVYPQQHPPAAEP